MYKQIIIVRKDLNMSPGKLAAQVSHASMAFLTSQLRKNAKRELNCLCAPVWEIDKQRPQLYKRQDLYDWTTEARARGEDFVYFRPASPDKPFGKLELCEPTYSYRSEAVFDEGIWNEWINGAFTKVILEAKNKNQLLKAVDSAKELDMIENEDYFLIKDNCYTELIPEETDENGIGRTLTCIGFRPMDSTIIDKIGKKYQLLH